MPEKVVLLREVRGDYSQHQTVCAQLFSFAAGKYSSDGTYFGIYPTDPDAIASTENMKWEVGIPVAVGADRTGSLSVLKTLRQPQAPYRLKVLPATDAAVLESDVRHSALDGLSMYRWMLENGYVQVAPTRMEFLDRPKEPLDIRTRIIIPVVKRRSGLKLLPR